MKINKFNENFIDQVLSHATFKLDGRTSSMLTDQDFRSIRRSGRKVYVINNSFEIVEIKLPSDLKYRSASQTNDQFPYALIIREDYLPTIKEKVDMIKQVKELSDKKIATLFEMVRALSEENGM
jgi:hypothetical protein